MKRIFQSKISTRRTGGLFYSIILFMAVLIAIQTIWPSVLSQGLFRISRPLISARDYAAGFFSSFASYVVTKENLYADNQRLSFELESARTELLRLRTTTIGETTTTEGVKGLDVTVLLRPPRSPYDSLVLDAGVNEGLSQGDMVLTDQGLAIGKITEVFRDFSRASLLSAPGNEIVVHIGSDSVQAQAFGVGGGVFEALLPQELEIEIGDLVTLPGRDRTVLGEVESLVNREVDFLQLIRFKIPGNIYEISRVQVLIGSGAENATP